MVYNDTTKEAERQQVQMNSIGVTLLENGKAISWRDYAESSSSGWNENTGILLQAMLGQRRKV